MTVTTLKKTEVTVREMGGAMGPIWHNYYKDAHAVIVSNVNYGINDSYR